MLPRKREKPRRRRPELVAHVRIKPKAGAPPTAEEKRHIAAVAAMPCLVCRAPPPSTVHHISSDGFKRIARSHKLVTPLCARHHQIQHGPRESVEALGHGGFELTYGINLLQEAERLWREREGA